MELKELYDKFPKNDDCLIYLEEVIWSNRPICPYCKSSKNSIVNKTKRYHCNNCNTSFSVLVNTIFHKTKIDLQKWFFAIMFFSKSYERITVRNLAKEINVTKDTAWRMIKQIKNAMLKQDYILKKIMLYGK